MALIRTARDAEQAACDWLKNHGHPDATCTPIGPDAGIDVIATGLVAQVKAEAKPVGRPVVQQIAGVGAHRRVQCACFALAGYTPQALLWADSAAVALFSFDFAGDIVPANTFGASIARGAGPAGARWVSVDGRRQWLFAAMPVSIASLTPLFEHRLISVIAGTAVEGSMQRGHLMATRLGPGRIVATTNELSMWLQGRWDDQGVAWRSVRSVPFRARHSVSYGEHLIFIEQAPRGFGLVDVDTKAIESFTAGFMRASTALGGKAKHRRVRMQRRLRS